MDELDKLQDIPSHLQAHFIFSQRFYLTQKKIKRACKPPHHDNAVVQCQLGQTTLLTDRRASANKVLPKAGVKCFYDTFVLNRTLVFQINSSAGTPRLRQYPKR
jgi:hypothetical protein